MLTGSTQDALQLRETSTTLRQSVLELSQRSMAVDTDEVLGHRTIVNQARRLREKPYNRLRRSNGSKKLKRAAEGYRQKVSEIWIVLQPK